MRTNNKDILLGMEICPVCKSKTNTKLCLIDGYTIWRCSQCATDFVSPMPDNKVLKSLYDREDWFEGGERGGYQSYDAQTEHTLSLMNDILNEFNKSQGGLSILDIGCGYGTHLAIAAKRGWKCFGVELSEYARNKAKERHGESLYIVESVGDLIPHEFDLILLFDVLEHFKDPYELFFSLFSKGAITPLTKIVITTPNARSSEAVSCSDQWTYRHPPSHLLYYSAESLRFLLKRLQFSEINIAGIYRDDDTKQVGFEDESFSLNNDLMMYAGLLCKAQGSDFISFMHERYVPGTWSKIAEYEHLPRYIFSQQLAAGKKVLDFGCGTGYGSELLAQVAESVVGIDINAAALQWANKTHGSPKLSFQQRADLGKGLPDQSFDVITCFEMIEHIDEKTQRDAVSNFSRLLIPGGKLIISTPNPEVTAHFGENPFHLHEMDEPEFEQLLTGYFKHVTMMKQWIRPSVVVDSQHLPQTPVVFCDETLESSKIQSDVLPAVFIAVCSNEPLSEIQGVCYFDSSFDYTVQTIATEKKLNELRFNNYRLSEILQGESRVLAERDLQLAERNQQLADLNRQLTERDQKLAELNKQLTERDQKLAELNQQLTERDQKLAELNQQLAERDQKLVKLNQQLTERAQQLAYHKKQIEDLLNSYSWKVTAPLRSLGYFARRRVPPAQSKSEKDIVFTPYQVQPLYPPGKNRPKIVHALANFMTGGSSRLVVDLIEHLGHIYEQEVITSYNPSPPSYLGVNIHDFPQLTSPDKVIKFLEKYRPNLLHVQYWGECDKGWYEQVFWAGKKYGCKIIENINTPVEPYFAEYIDRYVYVSEYVHKTFGRQDKKSSVIYPGSNFDIFKRVARLDPPDNCIGMVYRLESDKLYEQSIDVFIKVAQRRPETKILVVGGGTFLEPYKAAVKNAGLQNSFVFTGYVPYEKLPELYEKMSIFVAPVWRESFGQVSSFAMNMGIPVVGYNIGALPEIIANDKLLAPPGDSDKLAVIIIDLLNNHEKLKAIGASNRNRVQSLFSVQAMIDSYAKLYEALIEVKK